MRVFVLYRPRWPSLRAQALQVAFSASALAARGHDVTVCYHPSGPGDPLTGLGITRPAGLRLVPLPVGGTAASVAARARLARWCARGPGVLLAREKRLARWALRRHRHHPLVLEAHEVDSLQGRPALRLEREVLHRAAGLIANCEGVLTWLARLHDLPPIRAVVHNAGPEPLRRARGRGVVYAGSLLPDKDVETLAKAAPQLGGVTLIGAHAPSPLAALQRVAGGALQVTGPVRPAALLEHLAQFEVGVVSLGPGWFGEQLTSPLKAFTYRSAGLAVVGADTPAMHRALPDRFVPYRVGDPDSLVAAVQVARAGWSSLRDGTVRTWAERAVEVEAVLEQVHP